MKEDGIKFRPWVGPDYEKGVNGKKVMVLGHCHYCDDNSDDEGFTENIMRGYIQWVKQGCPLERDDKGKIKDLWTRTYRAFAKAFLGYESDEDEVSKVWDRVLFYNYVQVSVPFACSKPTTEDYHEAEMGFRSVLAQYEPDIILVWGNVYKKTPDNIKDGLNAYGCDINVEGTKVPCWEYTLPSGKTCKMLKLHHPSRGFSWKDAHKIIQEVL